MGRPHLYNFGLSQEDERTEAAALDLGPDDTVLSIASAGDMPLSLLALGAAHVHAVDVDPAQLHLARLKLAAVLHLDREDATAFLGFAPATRPRRLEWLAHVLSALPEDAEHFWLGHRDEVADGAIWAGRFERYIRRVTRIALPLVGRRRVEALLGCDSLDEQEAVFTREFDRPLVRALFRVAFHPRLFSRRGMDPRSLAHRDNALSLGDQYFQHFRWLCTRTPIKTNHLLQVMVVGRVLSSDSVPAYLSSDGVKRVRQAADQITFHLRDIEGWLQEAPPGRFSKAHLSNLPDWLDQAGFERVTRLAAAKCRRPGALVWRYIHVDRPLPADLAAVVRVDADKGRRLREQDRFPFYGVVCASLDPS